ncbi:MAG: anthranilate phosphoribosyltransferase [Dehalococcoidia bacterium]|jgi:anthranilate phosphoribosyltransferase|nr:anthranilate phosphoribosyltransferase [Dehalococcoidia bacterium]
MIREAIGKLVDGGDLTQTEAIQVMNEIMEGEATPAQLAGFITALRVKGETVSEIAGLARVMRDKALRVEVPDPAGLLDTCGTGGDASHTFNISTASALVAAGAGLRVAKHGNRAASSACGSADVLEALGVKIDVGPETVAKSIADAGIGFMFAPTYHPAMRHAAGPRRELGVRTVFNILGPLTNPARAGHQIVGVPRPELVETIANVLGELGTRHAIVVHGADGLDELSLSGPSIVAEYKNGAVITREVAPQELGLRHATVDQIQGGEIDRNRQIIENVLNGEPGPYRDMVVLNAAAALIAGDAATDFAGGIESARESLDSGNARERLETLVSVTQAT